MGIALSLTRGKVPLMEKLLAYLRTLDPESRIEFAERCSTSVGYLYKAISVAAHREVRLGGDLVVAIERESGGFVRCEDLRPDVDWGYVRATGSPFMYGKSAGGAP